MFEKRISEEHASKLLRLRLGSRVFEKRTIGRTRVKTFEVEVKLGSGWVKFHAGGPFVTVCLLTDPVPPMAHTACRAGFSGLADISTVTSSSPSSM